MNQTILFLFSILILFSACDSTKRMVKDQVESTETQSPQIDTSKDENVQQNLPEGFQRIPFERPKPRLKLRSDTTIIKGVLPNGLTYYLHSTDVTEKTASYYLIQNVGSIVENEEQQGLAHFLEHMAFNGTKNFPGKNFLNKMEKSGLVFGRDINAHTNFDETIYYINNVPTTTELTQDGLQILYDWCNGMLLSDEEIDAERGVILEEWRSTRSSATRLVDQTKNVLYNQSKYAQRLPLGQMDVVKNFEPEALREFYNQWYRTDLQAIAIIGDIDVEVMEEKVIAMFSDIPAADDPMERPLIALEDREELAYVLATDEEMAVPEISLTIKHGMPSSSNDFFVAFQEQIYIEIALMILNERLNDKAKNPDASFLFSQAGYGFFTRKHNALSLRTVPKDNRQEEAFTILMRELNKAIKMGFTQAEIDRARTKLKTRYQNRLDSNKNRPHAALLYIITNNYLLQQPMLSLRVESKIAEITASKATSKYLMQTLRGLFTKDNRTVIVSGIEGENNLTKEQVENIILKAQEESEYEVGKEEIIATSLMDGIELIPGAIINKTSNEKLNYNTFTLSNGINVHYKFFDEQKNRLQFQAISEGGTSLVNDEDFANCKVLESLSKISGIGNFTATDVAKILTGKSAVTSLGFSDTREYISGSSTTLDIEYMLQLVHLHFTKPRFTKESFDLLIQNFKMAEANYAINQEVQMRDTMTTLIYGNNHPVKRGLSAQLIEDLDLEVAKRIYSERFSNPADFELFLVGDIEEEVLMPLLELYIGSLPTTDEKEEWNIKSQDWITDNIEEDLSVPMISGKGAVSMTFEKDIELETKERMVVNAIGKILTLRLTESLRENEGGSYSTKAYTQYMSKPLPMVRSHINFECNPELMDNLVKLVYNEVENLKIGNIKSEDLEKVVSQVVKKDHENRNNANYHLNLMKRYVFEDFHQTQTAFVEMMNSITSKDIQEMAKLLFNPDRKAQFIFRPE